MTSYQTFTPAKPSDENRIPESEFAYFAARNRRKLYSAVIKEFKKSGLSQAQLARRMGKRPDVVCRWLSGPGNWTVDSVSNLLFAISGGELSYSISHPLESAPRNHTVPDWVRKEHDQLKSSQDDWSRNPLGRRDDQSNSLGVKKAQYEIA